LRREFAVEDLDPGMTAAILNGMKTAVSIPDPIFRSAEKAARRLHVSRSKLYARALSEYLRRDDARRTDQAIADFYGNEAPPVDPAGMAAQMRVLAREEW
jgi:hypothetical protein